MDIAEKKRITKTEEILWILYWIVTASSFAVFASVFILAKQMILLLPAVAVLTLVVLLYYISLKTGKKREKGERRFFPQILLPILIYLGCFISRWVYCRIMNPKTTQISDFLVVLEEAASGLFTDRLDYYRFYVHKFLYPYLLHGIGADTQTKIYLIQSIVVSFVPVLLYFIGKNYISIRAGICAAVIYIIWPVQIIYSSIVTEEHVASVLVLAIIWILISAEMKIRSLSTTEWKSGEWLKKAAVPVVLFLTAGILSGLNSFFKDWGSVIFVAVLISSIGLLIKYHSNAKRVVLILSVFLLFAGRKVTINTVDLLAEHVLGIEANNGGVVAMHMYGTLIPGAPGDYNGPANEEYRELAKQNNYDFKETNKQAMTILKSRIAEGIDQMPDLILRKGRMAYKDDSAVFFWVFEKELQQDTYQLLESTVNGLKKVDSVLWVFVVLAAFIAAFAIGRTKNQTVFFWLLCAVGFGMVSLLVESQGRYKYSIQPMWILLAVYGVKVLCDLILKMLNRTKSGEKQL